MEIFFSVIMPTYNQAAFIRRAISSLYEQTYINWELIIINDGCTDDTEKVVSAYLDDKRISYIKNEKNMGLGYAINKGLGVAKYTHITYLPSDDYYFKDHLELLSSEFEKSTTCVLVFSGLKYYTNDTQFRYFSTEDKIARKNYPIQLVQVAHKKNKKRWLERNDRITDDLFLMYWQSLCSSGTISFTNKITCYWSQHPNQRHKLISEDFGGGLNTYRSYYNVKEPIKIRISECKTIDEAKLYKNFRKPILFKKKHLKILIVGELAYNPERIYALEEAGHELYGLWISDPSSFNTVGPLPFGNIHDIPLNNYRQEIAKIKPDIIYALLNYKAVPLAYEVLISNPTIPFVWHFKEGPNFCMQVGTWEKLIYLYEYSDGRIYINETAKKWYDQFTTQQRGLSFILDGDLPKKEYFEGKFSSPISSSDNAIHTVVSGRMIGIEPADFEYLASENIHIHLYSENYFKSRESQIQTFQAISSKHFHIHPHCAQTDWVKEFSKYDAGWLHSFESLNRGSISLASWDDLNIPAKISTYAAAGLPMIMRDNMNNIVATQKKIAELNIGILFKNYPDLSKKLRNKKYLDRIRQNVLTHRDLFNFDHYVPDLIDFFNEVIKLKNVVCNENR